MWANLFSSIGKGVASGVGAAGKGISAVGKGIKKGVGALNEHMDEDEDGQMMTPPFVPGPSTTFPRDYAPFGATPGPRTDPARGVLLSAPSPPPAAPPGAMAPEMDLSGEGVPIPNLPGRGGGTTPYSPIAKAKYEHVMKGAESPAGGFKRSFKDIALNAVGGLAQGMGRDGNLLSGIGGALAAGAGTAINPEAGREYGFETFYRPEMEREEERARTSRRQRIEDALGQAAVDKIPREAAMDQAKIEQVQTQNKVAIENAGRQKALTESQIKLNDARAKAAQTGKPVIQDVVDENGSIRTYQIFGNGEMVELGPSAKAATNKANITSREKIATQNNQSAERRVGMQQGSANARNAATIAGAKERTQLRIDAQPQGGAGQSKLRKPTSGGGASNDQIQRIIAEAKKRGKPVTEAEVRARLKARGQ